MTIHDTLVPSRRLLSKVPEVTIYFWVIKVLCTTVGETAADFLNVNLNFGLVGTSVVTGILLVAALFLQFRADRYVPGRYWLAVTLVSVFGTLVTDLLTDQLGVPLEASSLFFGLLLAAVFFAWYRSERTLSIHSIFTRRRESFYWLTILVTFALGTATGDLMSQVLGLGYLVAGVIVAAMIAVTAFAWRTSLNPVLAFWVIYVLTRPLGASIGDYLAQPTAEGGLGLGATVTSVIFVVAIIATVTFLALTKADVISARAAVAKDEESRRGGMWQTALVVGLVLVLGGTGYVVRKSALQDTAAATPSPDSSSGAPSGAQTGTTSPLGDMSSFRTITQDTLNKLHTGDQSGATTRITDLETAWDNAEARLKPRDKAAWTEIDGKIDTVLRELRSTSPRSSSEKTALAALLGDLG
jgi:uncharacterized membrane-anchored protein